MTASQELIALGAANTVSSFFSSYPVTGSFSRTSVNANSGVRTPLSGVVTGGLVMLSLSFFTPAFFYVPKPALSAIIMAAVLRVVEWQQVRELWFSDRFDLLVGLVTFWVCLLAGVVPGVASGVAVNLAFVLLRVAQPSVSITHFPVPAPASQQQQQQQQQQRVELDQGAQPVVAHVCVRGALSSLFARRFQDVVQAALVASQVSLRQAPPPWTEAATFMGHPEVDVEAEQPSQDEPHDPIARATFRLLAGSHQDARRHSPDSSSAIAEEEWLGTPAHVILDLGNVSWIDSAGVDALKSVVRAAWAAAGEARRRAASHHLNKRDAMTHDTLLHTAAQAPLLAVVSDDGVHRPVVDNRVASTGGGSSVYGSVSRDGTKPGSATLNGPQLWLACVPPNVRAQLQREGFLYSCIPRHCVRMSVTDTLTCIARWEQHGADRCASGVGAPCLGSDGGPGISASADGLVSRKHTESGQSRRSKQVEETGVAGALISALV